jgi:beta-lactamase class A
MMIDRRFFLSGSLALGATACIPPDQSPIGRLAAELRIIEAAAGGALGVTLYDTASGAAVGINQDTRFPHASSFELSLAALLLQRHAAGRGYQLLGRDRAGARGQGRRLLRRLPCRRN